MFSPDTNELMSLLAEKYSLRFLERSKHHVGIHEGLCIDAFEFQGSIEIYVFSPTAQLGDEILDKFSGFVHLQESGIPPGWVRGNMITNRDVDQHGCILELTPSRLNDISMEQFLTIPQCLALDFEDLEANRPNLNCQNCGSEDSLELMVANRTYQVLCNQCFSDIKAAAPEGRLRYTEPVRWGAAIATLLFGTVLFVMVWGLLQQPSFDLRDGRLLLVVPFMSSVFLVGSVAKAARGHSVCLRLATVFAIIAATLAGNIWGLHSYALAQQIPITWGEAVELYFQHQLPNDSDREIFYLLGGAAGAWLGISMLKSTGFMRIE